MVEQLTLSPSEVHLWFIDLQKHIDVDSSILHQDEIDRANKFMVPEQKEAYLTCRFVLRRVLATYTKQDPSSVSLSYNAYGKPFLTTNPFHIQFNMSHSKNLASIGITIKRSIGVDVECINGQSLKDAVSLFLNVEEKEALRITLNPELALYHVWTQKEAVLKAMGTGFSHSPLTITGHVSSSVQLQNADVGHYKLNTFMKGSNIVSVCTSSPIELRVLDYPSYSLQCPTT